MKKLAVIVFSLMFIAACGNLPANTNSNANANKTPTDIATVIDRANPLSTPKSSIAYQFELVKAGDYEKLLDCLTGKNRNKLNQAIVDAARANAEKITFDDIFARVEEEENSNGKYATVKMRDNRTLTILKLEDGKWKSEHIWFR